VGTSPAASSFFAHIVVACAPIACAQQLSLPAESSAAGGSVLISAAFAPGSGPVSGLQFDLQYDSSAMSLVATAGDAARSSGKSLYYSDLNPNQRRFVLAGSDQNPIPAGMLVNLFVLVTPNASTGAHALILTNLSSVSPTGSSAPITGTNGSVSVTIGTGSRLESTGVLNAASLNAGAVAPGEIITLIGSGIGAEIAQTPGSSATSTIISGASVLFDGTPAPLLYAAPNQINAIVPFGVSGQDVTQMSVTSGGQLIAAVPLSVSASAPAIFTLDGSGAGAGAILNQDSSLNSELNPASRGSIVVIYATGAGQTDPPGVDGQVTGDVLSHATQPVAVQIGGFAAEILYAGAAPGLVAGVLQINCRVPGNAQPGVVSVGLTVGTATSPAGVNLAIQ